VADWCTTGGASVRGDSGSGRVNGPACKEEKEFTFTLFRFPMNTQVENKSRKIARTSEKYGTFLGGSLEHLE
jgi:hypothetical protein